MKDTLNRVRGAVSTKDMIPVLKHFAFRFGQVEGFDGRVHIMTPLPACYRALECTVDARQFIAAVDACDGNPTLDQVENRLIVRRNTFEATLSTGAADQFPAVDKVVAPAIPRGYKLLPDLRRLRSFVGEDASRAWACGTLFSEGWLYATNNVVLARVRTKLRSATSFDLPYFAIDELLRIDEEPVGMCVHENAATFTYKDGTILRSQLFANDWPSDPARFLEGSTRAPRVPADSLKAAVEALVPFCADPKFPIIVLEGDVVRTQEHVNQAKVSGFKNLKGAFHARALLSVLEVATNIDFSAAPRVPWHGNGIEGLLTGIVL